jgi:hypothetical protein
MNKKDIWVKPVTKKEKQKLLCLKKDTLLKLSCDDEWNGVYLSLSNPYISDSINGEKVISIEIIDTYCLTTNKKVQLNMEWFRQSISEWEVIL